MRLSNELSIRPATQVIATLPFKPSREIRCAGFRRHAVSRTGGRPISQESKKCSVARRLFFDHLGRLLLILAIVFIVAASIKPALAMITVHEARYAAGVLVVRGETTTPLQEIGLDNRYFTKADERGRFLFRIQYLPHDCTIKLGEQDRPHIAFVEGCLH